MVEQHNLTAMNSNRQLGITTGIQAKSSEKLSSGYKINRAADDAAGLAISEKMRRQIRGLSQGADNIQDGISMLQIGDGALEEVMDMLHRMTTLSVKEYAASSGTAEPLWRRLSWTILRGNILCIRDLCARKGARRSRRTGFSSLTARGTS